VALVNPPSAPGTVANREGAAGMGTVYDGAWAFLYPPHTLATVAAALRDAGHDVRAIDATVQEFGPADVAGADVVGIFASYASLDADLTFIATLREVTSARFIVFGPSMRFVGERVLSSGLVDAVLVGEAEGFFGTMLKTASADDAVWAKPRLWTAEDAGVSCCDAEGFVQDLDALPQPAWDLLPTGEYNLLTVLSSRGCPDHCAYCPYAAAQGRAIRSRSTGSVLGELSWLQEAFRPARLVFRDPVFAYDRSRVVALCEGILQRGLRLRWECESRPEHFDTELLRLMQRAGCQWVKIGLETTDAALLQRLRRVRSPDEAARYLQCVAGVVRACSDVGMRCRLFAMAGLPGQDLVAAQETRRFLVGLHPTAVNVKAFDWYPGLDLEAIDGGDPAAQLDTLRQAQQAVQRRGLERNLFARARRRIRGALRGQERGVHGEGANG
jgi:anaerobic magnesium-protoporphyrin IX monomethyl ester cyclase